MSYVHPEYLISVQELAGDIDNSGRRILDATVFLTPAPTAGYRAESGQGKFDEGHIPGAVFLDLIRAASDTSTGLGFSLPPVAQLAGLFGSLGIGDDTEVVLYSTGHMMWATRAWWLFHYCGHANARVLDGGFRAWRDAGQPISTETTAPAPQSFRAQANPNLFVDKDGVLAAIGDSATCTVKTRYRRMSMPGRASSPTGGAGTSRAASIFTSTICSTTATSRMRMHCARRLMPRGYLPRPK